jgi:hypothetical protein
MKEGHGFRGCGKGRIEQGSMLQGLKPNLFPAFTARLKSCPDTKRQELLAQLSLIYPGPSDGTAEREKRTSAAKAVGSADAFTARLKPCPSFDGLPHPRTPVNAAVKIGQLKNLIWQKLKLNRPSGTECKFAVLTQTGAAHAAPDVFHGLAGNAR